AELVGDSHPHVTVNVVWQSFGMKGDKIERRAGLARCVVFFPQAMLQKVAREASAAACRVGAADTRRGQRAADGCDGVVVQLMKFLRRPTPIANVWLVPDFPVPRLDLFAAVSLQTMPHPLTDQLAPLVIVLRRIGPAGKNLVVPRSRRPVVLIGLGLD